MDLTLQGSTNCTLQQIKLQSTIPERKRIEAKDLLSSEHLPRSRACNRLILAHDKTRNTNTKQVRMMATTLKTIAMFAIHKMVLDFLFKKKITKNWINLS